MVYHVTDYVAATSNLTYALKSALEEVDRCQDMLVRLSALKPNDPVPCEVRDFIEYYTGTEGFAEAVSTAGDVVGKILVTLKNIVVRIFEILCDLFKMIFDTEYRVRKQFADIQRSLIQMSSDPEAVERFEKTPASVISQEDCLHAISVSVMLINLMELLGRSRTTFELENILDEVFQKKTKIKIVKGVITDDFTELVAKHWPTLEAAGWTLKNLNDAITNHIDCLTNFEMLKGTEQNTKSEAKRLQREIDKMLAENNPMVMVQGLQQRVAICHRITKSIGEAANILVKRTGAITTILRALHVQMMRVVNELKAERTAP